MKKQSAVKKTRISLDCLPEEHQKIKIYATLHRQTLSEYILEFVRQGMRKEHIKVPNKETIQAFEENDRGEGVESYESVEEMFKALGM
jgi:hypothetical protein